MIRTLTDEQYAVFMVKIPEAPIRDRCIMLLMLHAGLRNGEVCGLRFNDLYLEGSAFTTIEIHNGHGNNELVRLVPLSVALVSALEAYYPVYVEKFGRPDPHQFAFITRNQKMPIQQRDVQRITQKWTSLWLGTSFHPHLLRHTFATRLMRKTSIRVVQDLLGHLNLGSTQKYTHPTSEDCKNAVNQTF